MDIISFFRSIDGVPYYIMLVVNAILIFAIVGYLGDKKNEKYIKMGMQTNIPNSSGGLNLNPVTQDKHSAASIPTVAATMVNVPVTDNISDNVMETTPTTKFIDNNLPVQNSSMNNGMFINNSIDNTNLSTNNVEQGSIPQIIKPEDNNVDPNEKAPAVLVINSDNTNMPK